MDPQHRPPGRSHQPQGPQVVVVQLAATQSPRYLSGLTSGQELVHLTLTILTVGTWAPVWWLHSRLGRRRIF